MRLGRTLLSVTALAWSGFGAVAADMPVKAPRVVEAQPLVSGYVELYGGGAWTKITNTFCEITCSTFSDRVDGWALGGAGRATYWWSPNGSIQLDAQGEGTSYKFSNGGNFFSRSSSHSYLIGGHASWRDPQRGLIGVFGGAGDTTGGGFGSNASIRHGLVGLEGQLYWGMLTLYGQVGYDSTLGAVSSAVDSFHAWFLRGTARFYVNPNFRLEGTVLYANVGVDYTSLASGTSVDMETWLWRAKAEYRFATAPFSVFVTYEGSQTTIAGVNPGTYNAKITDNRILGGLRLYLGENTLQWNDRRGTTLDIIAPHSVPSMNLNGGIMATVI